MQHPFVSIIVPVRNEEQNLPRLFSSFKKLIYPKDKYEVIIVDGESTDKTVALAKQFGANIYTNPQQIRSTGCQIGIDHARGMLIAFTDADCMVPRDWLTILVPLVLSKQHVASAGGPNQTPIDDSMVASIIGDSIEFITRPGARYGYKGKEITEIYHNSGCNVLYKKSALKKVKGFLADLLTCEDEELDYRLRKEGFTLLYTPDVIVDHYRRSTFLSLFTQMYRYGLGRVQASSYYPLMMRWYYMVPSLISLFVILSIVLGFMDGWLSIIFIFELLGSIGISMYYSRKRGLVYWPYYFLALWTIIFGYGMGVITGFFQKLPVLRPFLETYNRRLT